MPGFWFLAIANIIKPLLVKNIYNNRGHLPISLPIWQRHFTDDRRQKHKQQHEKTTSSAFTGNETEAALQECRSTAKKEKFLPQDRVDGINDKVALVNGGTDGIGLRCVKELLKCGARAVMIADQNEKVGYKWVNEFAKSYGANKVAFIRNDPSDEMHKNVFKSTLKHYRGLDIVINNIKFKEKNNWSEQIDETVKSLVLSTMCCMQFMGRHNGGKGGTLVNIAACYPEDSMSCPVFSGVQEFLVAFDRTMASDHYSYSNVKVLTICQATLESIGFDLATVISKGKNGCVWTP